ncbi:MAG: DUF932 domain-containing protein [Sporomusaceae bacterium]|nr:DUF932 domain-containing protein [Sporomusaceae bacterium]
MKTGRSILDLAKELERQRKVRKDYISDTRNLEVETEKGRTQLRLALDQGNEVFTLNELAHKQLAERLQIPIKYYNRMRFEYPSLLDDNINCWFSKTPERRMLRTLDGEVRAVLSDRYRRLDHLELVDAVLPVIKDMGQAEIISCEVTATHLYLKVIHRKMKAEVTVGDVVQAGFVISNSEVGLGSLKVEPLIFRLVCKNGLIVKDYAQRRYHVGRQVEQEDSAYEIFSDETLAQDDKAFFMKMQDTVRVAVDEANFQLTVDKMKASLFEETGPDPIKTVEVLADRYTLSQSERGGILRYFLMGRDSSRYGLINAVTRASQDLEDYTRATELERLGGELLALPSDKKPLLATPSYHSGQEKNVTAQRFPLEVVR